MTSNISSDKKASIVQWRNGSGSDSSNALPTSIAVIPTSNGADHPQNAKSKISQTICTIKCNSPKCSFFGKPRIRAPSLVWEGVAGPLTGCVTAPASPRVTAMGVATTVNATAEAMFSQHLAGSLAAHHSGINCRSDGATPTPPSPTSDLPEFSLRPNKPKYIRASSYGPPSLAREDSVLNSLECWDYSVELECLQGPDDLQLAAELGKTLLERNKELENSLKEQQAIIDDQAQEIEYLTKQTTTLREINDSRVKIYEQLEVSIADLESTNKQLVEESKTDKTRIKSLCANINRLDARCEDLQRCLDETRLIVETSERKNKSSHQNFSSNTEKKLSHSENTSKNAKQPYYSSKENGISDANVSVQTSNELTDRSETSINHLNQVKNSQREDKIVIDTKNHLSETSLKNDDDQMPSLNEELNINHYIGSNENLPWNSDSVVPSKNFSALSNCDASLNAKSEDSGYENGDASEKCYIAPKEMDIDTFQNNMSSSSSSCSPAPKSSSSGSRVGSAFSDSPLESEEPVSIGTDSSKNFDSNPIKGIEAMNSIDEHVVYSHRINSNITHLEMEESRNTVNEMERAILDLKAENLRLKLDLGVKNEAQSGSIDESLRSVDEEVQEVTAVRLGKLCRRCLGINDATPGILIDKAMDLMGETLVSELQQCFGSSPDNWVQHLKSSRVWLDAWLAGLCACAFLISLLRRAFDVSSSITYDLLEAWSNR